MELVKPEIIPRIDAFAEEKLNIPKKELMGRAGEAVLEALKELFPSRAKILILAGKGNNGGDGYALGAFALDLYEVTVIDVFSAGQRSEEGKFYYDQYLRRGGRLVRGTLDLSYVYECDVVIDAVFGTGMSGVIPTELHSLAERIASLGKRVIAVDIPLGVNGGDGSVCPHALKAEVTVQLSYLKAGTLSYPAREYLGQIRLAELGIPRDKIREAFEFSDFLTDSDLAAELLPKRGKNTNKGSFGKALLITGSEKYEGAGRLTLEACLRGGAGIVTVSSTVALRDKLIKDFPEALYAPFDPQSGTSRDGIAELSRGHSATLIGSGSGVSSGLFEIVKELISLEGGPLVLDADALNSLAKYGSKEILKEAKRTVILTPHPLEFSRLSGHSVEEINSARIKLAKEFSKEYGCILLLKGASTVITDGETMYINSTGNSALAKGGSGDALAGLLVSLLAFSENCLKTTALSAYVHGEAGDRLAREYSEYGVTPSDLPKEMARVISELSMKKEK